MPVQTNARTATQKELTQKFTEALGAEAEWSDIRLDYKGQKVFLSQDEDVYELTYGQLKKQIEELAAAEVEAEPDPRQLAAEAEKERLIAQAQAAKSARAARETDEQEARRLELRGQAEEMIGGLINDINRERSGELSQNSARLSKGKRLYEFEALAQALRELGDPEFAERGAPRKFARRRVEEALEAQGIIEPDERLSDSEVSMTEKVWEKLAMNRGGLDASFYRVGDWDPRTNQPLVNDAGEPLTERLVKVPLNRLYYIADYVDDGNYNLLTAFAYRHTEKVLQLAVRLWDKKKGNAAAEVEKLNDLRVERVMDEEEGITIETPANEKELMDYLNMRLGSVKTDVASLVFDRGIYDGAWTRLVEAMALAYKRFNLYTEEGGKPSTSQILERLLATVDPEDWGGKGVARMLVLAEDISEAQARTFIREWETRHRKVDIEA